MHALDAGRVAPDLEAWPRRRQVRDLLRVELEGDVRLGLSCLVDLVVVRAQGGSDEPEERSQDPVLVEARHVVQRRADLHDELVGCDLTVALEVRVEPGLEHLDEQAGDRAVGEQRLLDVVLAEGRTRLA